MPKGVASEFLVTATVPIEIKPTIFQGTLAPLVIHFDRVETLAIPMRELWENLSAYAQEIEEVDTSNTELVAKADALRRQLEAVFSQRITFMGEKREPSGRPVIVGTADVERIAGLAAGVIAGSIEGGEVRGEVTAKEVESGGIGAGVKVDRIGN